MKYLQIPIYLWWKRKKIFFVFVDNYQKLVLENSSLCVLDFEVNMPLAIGRARCTSRRVLEKSRVWKNDIIAIIGKAILITMIDQFSLILLYVNMCILFITWFIAQSRLYNLSMQKILVQHLNVYYTYSFITYLIGNLFWVCT